MTNKLGVFGIALACTLAVAARADADCKEEGTCGDAQGTSSVALGEDAVATGNYSIAVGYSAEADALQSIAVGWNAKCEVDAPYNAIYSIAVGRVAESYGSRSVAIGMGPDAYGERSLAVGYSALTEAAATYASAIGYDCTASDVGATAIGKTASASNDYAYAFGYSANASGNRAYAIGNAAAASNERSLAVGYSTSASGLHSTAIGYDTTALGSGCTAMGYETECTADSSYGTAMGWDTSAQEDYATAMGYDTTASGLASTAIGYLSVADGGSSTAMGYETDANAYASVAIGRYNVGAVTGGGDTGWVPTDPVFEVGIGTGAATRSNALTVLKNGKVGIKTATPPIPLQVLGGTNVSLSNGSGYLIVGSESGSNIAMDLNTIQARAATAATILRLQGSGGNVQMGAPTYDADLSVFGDVDVGNATYGYDLRVYGEAYVHDLDPTASAIRDVCSTGINYGWLGTCDSSRRHKEDIVDLGLGLPDLERLRPVAFTWRATDARSLGFIAEEVAEVHPILATYDKEGRPKGVRYREMTALLTNAVLEVRREAQEELSALRSTASEQEAQLTSQAKELAELRATLAKQQRMLEALAAKVGLEQ